jgi:RNA polymerase sigma-70 factor (ECF subfamily)
MSGRALGALSDGELLERTRAGDGRSFEVVYRRHHAVVLTFLARRVGQPELAADLLAETFAALLVLVRDPLRSLPVSPVAWLMLTARNLLIDSYRRGQVEAAARRLLAMRPLLLEDRDLLRVEEISAETDLLGELAARLPPEQFEALRARVIDESDYPTIAGELRCSEAVVRQRVSRALRALRRDNLETNDHA